MENNNELMEMGAFNISADIQDSISAMFCSVDGSTREGQITIYNALNSPTARLAEMIGKTILVSDVIAEPSTVYNESGEAVETIRLVLITADGKSYTCVSVGIYNAVKKLIAVFGLPTWIDPLPLEVRQVSRKGRDGQPRNVLTLQLAKKG